MVFISSVPSVGSMGPDVITIQQQLIFNGHNPGNVDGIFGNKTQKAISELQKDHGLAGSGLLGPKTLAYLGITVNSNHPITNVSTITKDLIGKKDRHIHPAMRIMLESYLFPAGGISSAWKNKDIPACHIEANIALSKIGVFEKGGNNMGYEVGLVQSTIGDYKPGGNGDSWCLYYEHIPIAIIEDFFGIESPVPAIPHCVTLFNESKLIPGLTTKSPTAGSLAIGRHKGTMNGHAMGVVALLPNGQMRTSEGNTSMSSMTDGDGSGIKTRDCFLNGDLETMGFVFTYPGNKI